MKSIFFGSIGVLTESSQIQRRAFKEAFKDFLAENWVFIDFLHFWKMQGIDILKKL